jgi:CRP-like cAMP-binding protein
MTVSQTYLKDLLNSIVPFTNEEFKTIASVGKEKVFKKGSLLQTLDDDSDHAFFITKGIVRSFSKSTTEEHTYYIHGIGDFVTDPISYMIGGKSKIAIEALVNTHVIYAKKVDLEKLMYEIPKVCLAVYKLYQKITHDYHQHLMLLKVWPTQKREETLFENKPFLFRKEVKVKHLASLLNVHPNSLSRIHNKKAEASKILEE